MKSRNFRTPASCRLTAFITWSRLSASCQTAKSTAAMTWETSTPPSLAPTFLQLDFSRVFEATALIVIGSASVLYGAIQAVGRDDVGARGAELVGSRSRGRELAARHRDGL